MAKKELRLSLLGDWAVSVAQAATAGALSGGKPLSIRAVETVRGPRAGALEIDAGLDAGKLLRALTADDCALHRQFVPWAFTGEPSVYMAGRCVRLEAGWPDDLAEKDIRLSDLGQHPKAGGRWIAGKNEVGATVTLSLSDKVPTYLFGGFTGSGKTWTLRCAIGQLAQDPENRFVLIDGKWGDGLGCLRGIPGLVGPLATTPEDAVGAMTWTVQTMQQRYESGNKSGRIIVVIDEVQEFTQDERFTALLRRFTAQCRGAQMYTLVGTQNPMQECFNDPNIKRNLVGRVALRTDSYEASRVVVGSNTPRADKLLGAGDGYAVVPGVMHRVQMAYIPERDLGRLRNGGPLLSAWPDYDPEVAGAAYTENEGTFQVSGVEAAVTLLAAHLGQGRPKLQTILAEAVGARPGSGRAKRLLDLGREGYAWLQNAGWTLCDDFDDSVNDADEALD